LDLDPNLPQSVFIDEKRFRQVFINLIGNAIKFTEQGSVTFRVKVLECKEAYPNQPTSQQIPFPSNTIDPKKQEIKEPTCLIRFSVEDTGIGMTPEQLDKIFLPFEQAGNYTQQSNGTGLGLAISKQIVELMGSRLNVQSQLGEGSIFWLDLAIPVTHHNQQTAQLTSSKLSVQHVVGIREKDTKLLIIENNDENLALLISLLQPMGFVIQTANDSITEIESVLQYKPNLIITDLMMPLSDGIKRLEKLCKIANSRDIPVVVISASVFEKNQQESLAVGASAFLPKPLNFNDLLNTIKLNLDVEFIYDKPPIPLLDNSSYKDKNRSNNSHKKESFLLVPETKVLEELCHLAQMGDLHEIETKLDNISVEHPEFKEFNEIMKEMIEKFQVRYIKSYLQSHITSASDK
ncbi:ATP-binding protein, partial [Okeania sp. SIO2G5]|uniref:ATP-binding protein n=1 Tax=Okeania sp. SIO2G5 TaxID=2607796 RepID=UPI0013C148CF